MLGAVNLWRRGERVAHIDLGDVGAGHEPVPLRHHLPQDEHERLLIERLEAAGVRVERRTKLTSIGGEADGVVARLRAPDGTVVACEAQFLAGCDGARSAIREAIGAGFPGGTYEHLFYVADVEARGAPMNRELHVLLDDAGFLGALPACRRGPRAPHRDHSRRRDGRSERRSSGTTSIAARSSASGSRSIA